jgi:TatD DNase family protein
VVIHSREATEDTVRILRDAGFGGRRVVFHCFTGTPSEVRLIRDQGWRVSFTGVVTFKNAGDIRRVARDYPADEIMIETDAPFLSPEPVRNVRPNEPALVVHTARFLAELRGRHLEELAEQTTRNAAEFFGLDDAAGAP